MSAGHDDYAAEPIPGLPEKLPKDEHILWQGAPRWGELAIRAFHARGVALYFAALMIWRGGSVLARGGSPLEAAGAALSLAPLAAAAIGLLALASWMTARATLYTITNKRVVMRIGVALTKTINIPFKVIETASMQADRRDRGEIALKLVKPNRIGLFHLWPNARPWHVNQPQPSLRALGDVASVADILGNAMKAAASGSELAMNPATRSASIPSSPAPSTFPIGDAARAVA